MIDDKKEKFKFLFMKIFHDNSQQNTDVSKSKNSGLVFAEEQPSSNKDPSFQNTAVFNILDIIKSRKDAIEKKVFLIDDGCQQMAKRYVQIKCNNF